MAALSASSARAIARLRRYEPPPTIFNELTVTRKAAVLILLFPDKSGELRVVLTMRASTLRAYAGQAALPGGKSDDPSESPFETARREAFEEIGLPLNNELLPATFSVEHICELPTNLARTELGVRPCVAFLSARPHILTGQGSADATLYQLTPSVEEALIPRLDAKEVAAVFTAPLRDFLRQNLDVDLNSYLSSSLKRQRTQLTQSEVETEDWYRGMWIDWYGKRWRMHSFYVPIASGPVAWPADDDDAAKEKKDKVKDWQEHSSDVASLRDASVPARQRVTQEITGKKIDPPADEKKSKALATSHSSRENSKESEQQSAEDSSHFRVWGMTARILVDAARIAYDMEPEFEYNDHFGDEELIAELFRAGKLTPIVRRRDKQVSDGKETASKM